MGPSEPDAGLYAGYPITRSSWKRKLFRDLRGMGVPWRNLPTLHAELVASGWITDAIEVSVLHGVLAGCIEPR